MAEVTVKHGCANNSVLLFILHFMHNIHSFLCFNRHYLTKTPDVALKAQHINWNATHSNVEFQFLKEFWSPLNFKTIFLISKIAISAEKQIIL